MNRSACDLASAVNRVDERAAYSASATMSALCGSTTLSPPLTAITTDVVDLTDSRPSAPLTTTVATASPDISSTHSRDGTPYSKATTIHLHGYEHGNDSLPECLDETQWTVSEVLKIKKGKALVSWEPTVMTIKDTSKTLGGISLLNFAQKAERMGDDLLRVHWQPTWEPCKELRECEIQGQHFDLDQGEHVTVYPLTIEQEACKSAHVVYLVRFKPTFVTTKSARALDGIFGMEDFDVEQIERVDEDTYGITWEPKWVRPIGKWAMVEWMDQQYRRRATWKVRTER